MASDLETAYTVEEGAAIVRVGGRVTYEEAPELRDVLFRAIDEGGKRLAVHLGGVERIDTAGLAVLVEALMAGRGRRTSVSLVAASPAVEQVFQLAGFVRMLSAEAGPQFDDALRRCCCSEPRGDEPA